MGGYRDNADVIASNLLRKVLTSQRSKHRLNCNPIESSSIAAGFTLMCLLMLTYT